MPTVACHVCDSTLALGLGKTGMLERVGSDATSWAGRPDLAWCSKCRTVITVVTEEWSERCSNLYSHYRLYAQSSDSDQAVFGQDGSTLPRSARLLDAVLPAIAPETGPVLDFGCGTGALLSEVGKRLPGCPLMGLDFDDLHSDHILGLPGVVGFHTDWSGIADRSLGSVLMTHVLEHLVQPAETLMHVRRSLSRDGNLLVQVPDVLANPYMLAVGDHATHFDLASLDRLLTDSGFGVVLISDDIIPGELTALATPLGTNVSGQTVVDPLDFSGAERIVQYLVNVEQWLRSFRSLFSSWGIFGTSIAGTWAAASVDDDFDFWVDEDPARIGRQWRGRPIYSPAMVPAESTVAVTLAPLKAQGLVSRIQSDGFPGQYLVPPHLS